MLSGLVGPVSAQRKPQQQHSAQKRPFLPPKPRDPLQQEFAPIPNGPGIQICKPVASENDAALGDFGDGCGLWLQWTMGFHPELGQTPRWDLAIWAHRQFHLPRLRLSLAQGSRLVNLLGVTHVAVGQISGTPTKCLLTYQLYAVPAQKAVGAPLRLAGTEAEVIAQLPEAARAILAGLGVRTPHVPASVAATPEDLAAIGHYDVYETTPVPAAEQQQLELLTTKLPLASLLSFEHHGPPNLKDREKPARRVVEQASGNFLMLGVVVTYLVRPSEELAHLIDSKVATIGAPNNAVLAYWAASRMHTQAEYVKAYGRIVRLAPHSSLAWYILAQSYARQGETIRLARVWSGLSAQEAQTLEGIYAHWVYAAARTTEIDPDYQAAWHALASAATFAGNPERADAAFWKAYALDKSDLGLYVWGLEMYQSKWGGDPQTLAKVAHLAAQAVFPPNSDLFSLGVELRSAGFPADAKTMFARAIVQEREIVRQYPNDSGVHAALGYYLADMQQNTEAETELKTALRLAPDSPSAHSYLGRLYRVTERYPEAVREYRESVRLTNSYQAKLGLAEALTESITDGHYEEPEQLLNEALKSQPNEYQGNEAMGRLLVLRKQYDAALTSYGIVARLQRSLPREGSYLPSSIQIRRGHPGRRAGSGPRAAKLRGSYCACGDLCGARELPLRRQADHQSDRSGADLCSRARQPWRALPQNG